MIVKTFFSEFSELVSVNSTEYQLKKMVSDFSFMAN